MKDDSNINDNTPKKSKIERAQSYMTDSFRMAASVLGTSNAASRKAITLTVPSTLFLSQILRSRTNKAIKNNHNAKSASFLSENSASTIAVSVPMPYALLAPTQQSTKNGINFLR